MRAKGLLSIIAVCVLLISTEALAQDRHSCSTFQMTSGDTIVVGHNLDDYVVFPGMMIVNPRGIEKENLSCLDFTKGKKKKKPRLKWTSKYGSVTYSIFGRELIDGGLNEAGLYIGEMTLMETIYPVIEGKPTFHTNLWMQYILDCYATVDEAIKNLPNYNLDGTCRWHFLLADASGNVSVIEFLKGRAIVYRGADVPHKILCNTTYQNDLDSLQRYVGYGGERAIDIQDKENTKRSVRAAEILKRYSDDPKTPIVDYSFDLLSLLDLGNNLWQITCDISNKRIYFRTQLNKNIKFVDFQSCDFSDTTLKYIDIHVDESHDVSSLFDPLTDKINKKYVRKTWRAIDMGPIGNIFAKPYAVWGLGLSMTGYTSLFYQKENE